MAESRDKLTLEKMQINDRLTKLELSHFDLRTDIKEFVDGVNKNIEKLNSIIIGDGAIKGQAERLRNLEEAESKRQKHVFFIWSGIFTSIFASLGTFIWNKITGR